MSHLGQKRAPRRLALFTGNYHVVPDGVSLTLNRLVTYLERHGWEVLVFGPAPGRSAMPFVGDLVPVRSIPIPGRAEYRIALGFPGAARARFRAFRPDLVHVATPDILGNRALYLSSRLGIPVVASYHTHFCSYLKYYGLEELEGFLWKYLRKFYRHCRHLYVGSASIAAVLRAHEITRSLRLWERGVDTSVFNPGRRSMEWRRELGLADYEPLVTFVGRLVWEKGLEVFVQVIEALRAAEIPHRSLVVGDGPALPAFRARLPDTIFTGFLEPPAVARAYASSDVFLFPSDTETFGNVILEAMASGLPAVCADATGSSSLVVHEHTGFLAEPGDPRSFLQYVVALVTDGDLRTRLGDAAIQRAGHYDWDATLGRLVEYYEEILDPGSKDVALLPSAPVVG